MAQASSHEIHARSTRSQIRWRVVLRMSLLLALGALIVVKGVRGELLLYVNGIYVHLILAAGMTMIALGYIAGLNWIGRNGSTPPPHDHHTGGHFHVSARVEALGYALLTVPLVIGVLVPARPLGTAALNAQTNTGGQAVPSGRLKTLGQLDDDSSRWTLLDWNAALTRTPDPQTLIGKPVSIIGFAASGDGGLGVGHFTVARFVVICCTADGNALTLPVQWQVVPPRDTWVQVTGTLAVRTVDGKPVPYVAATRVQVIPQPGQPYLYP